MINKFKNKIKERKGVTVVETVIMLPFLIIFLGIMITGGQMVSNKNTLNYATQVAAREASVKTNYSEGLSVAKAKAEEILKANGLSIDTIDVKATTSSGWSKGNELKVTVSARYKTLFPVPMDDMVLSTEQSMTSNITVLIERGN